MERDTWLQRLHWPLTCAHWWVQNPLLSAGRKRKGSWKGKESSTSKWNRSRRQGWWSPWFYFPRWGNLWPNPFTPLPRLKELFKSIFIDEEPPGSAEPSAPAEPAATVSGVAILPLPKSKLWSLSFCLVQRCCQTLKRLRQFAPKLTV